MSRGIIITPKFDFDGTTLHFPGLVGIDPVSLRQYLLYWDKIDFPNNNLIGIGSSSDIQFLIDQNILSRTEIKFSNFHGNIGYGYIYSQIEALKLKNRSEPGQWSLAQTGNHLFIPDDVSDETKTFEIELYNMLPVPSEFVSLDDIILFKNRYNDELIAFRSQMDELYLGIINSGDIPRARIMALTRLEQAIKDLNIVANESFASRLLSSLKVELNLPSLLATAITGSFTGAAFGLSPEIGAAIGATSAAIKFDLSLTKKVRGLPKELKAYAYLHRIERELNT
jgi:hypothetical protein